MIEVLQAGLCDLVMDGGRPGWGSVGVPAGGAADPAALAAANRLVGNAGAAAGLEIVERGPSLRFPRGGVVALTGARLAAVRSSGAPLGWNQTLVLAPGETLTLGRAEAGCRSWLAVRGGLRVPACLGSRSTFLPGGFGGHAGRALQVGDRLRCGDEAASAVRLLHARAPAVDPAAPLRSVPGPQVAWFDDRGLAAFFAGRYQVHAASDRRGVRLEGAPVSHARAELPSQGVLAGAVQVPPDGRPIVLGWDGPVTGGYPVIACVITADLSRLAQLRAGDSVRFATIEIDTARALAAEAWEIRELG